MSRQQEKVAGAALVSLGQIFVSFVKVGAVLFGGGYAMLPLLEREVVSRRGWCAHAEMADYYAMAQLVPGVVAVNTSMLIGHRLRDFWGTVAATAGVVFVPFFVILAYAVAFDRFSETKAVSDAMSGLRPAVAGLMLGVAFKMFGRSRKTRLGLAVAAGVPVLILVCGASAVMVIVSGAAAGVLWFFASWRRGRASGAAPAREGGLARSPGRADPPSNREPLNPER